MIDDPRILNIGTRILVFSDENQITFQDMAMADVAILIQGEYFSIIKDRYKEQWKEKIHLHLLAGTLDYYYEQIRLRLQNNF